MAEVINLNRYRKAKAQQDAKRRTQENRIKHGLTKVERDSVQKEREKRQSELDGKQID